MSKGRVLIFALPLLSLVTPMRAWNRIISRAPTGVSTCTNYLHTLGGKYSVFQVSGMIEWRQKSKAQKIPRASNNTQKNPMPKIPSLKNFQKGLNDIYENILKPTAKQVWLYFIRRTTRPGYTGTTTNLQLLLNTQNNPYLNQVTQKNTCQIFLPQKISESIISNPKNPSIITDT